MGQPDLNQNHSTMLEWLNKDCGRRVFCVGSTWYSRRDYRKPHSKHKSLHDAVIHAMQYDEEKL
jgi:hypothetical protein